MSDSDNTISRARRHLRCHFEGSLTLGDRIARTAYIRDPADGSLIAAVERWISDKSEATLLIPDPGPGSLELHVGITLIDPNQEYVCDRWPAYHGSASHRAWARLAILAGKLDGEVIEGSDLSISTSLRTQEPGLVKRANADRGALARFCERFLRMSIPAATCVGVDQFGMDLRSSIGPVRLDIEEPARAAIKPADHATFQIESGADIVKWLTLPSSHPGQGL
ncbi:MAG: hypothetical protein AB7G11_06730 [Phycisphaerales bacterium]